ncbi:MAG TPA: DUF3455 domain-containing protein [Dissulfurispiraceae bacterium]|nr:DUF3455 domain-containing protein [Dissulfurispiraceae bacterium]
MKRSRTAFALIAGIAVLNLCCLGLANSSDQQVPESLKVPADQTLFLKARGVGVQIYECMEDKTDSSKFKWTFKSPEASLFDNAGKQIGKHYAGPTWKADDGSTVVGSVGQVYDSPNTNSIPWLLLRAKSTSGPGIFSHVISVQRLNTMGGKAPSDVCEKEQVGKEIRVPYKAMYYFYTLRQ